MKFLKLFSLVVLTVFVTLITSYLYQINIEKQEISTIPTQHINYQPTISTPIPTGDQPIDFKTSAAISTPTVVHIKNTQVVFERNAPSIWDYLGGGAQREPISSGSGVIISSNGYIVSNNHVVDNSIELLVTLNDNRTYIAELIGADPSTDLSLLKIDADNLPFARFGNSDNVAIGEWVLAVGNPFNLTSTVTAGIVSAKARNIDIIKSQSNIGAVESFIQTDAAVNPGNSGGALVNTSGELIGINTAIASYTGSYSGYSFAIPSNLAQKVVVDLKEFGVVQRGLLGVGIRNVDNKLAIEKDLNMVEGVYIDRVSKNSGAEDAGLQEGDVIFQVNNSAIKTVPELQETIARKRPSDEVEVYFIRNDQKQKAMVILKDPNQTN